MKFATQSVALRIAAAVLMLALTACAKTTVTTRLALEPAKSATLKYTTVDVASSTSTLPTDVAGRLKTAVSTRLAQLPQGASPVKLQLTIDQFRVVPPSDRFMTGVMAGANVMNVRVLIVDDRGTTVSDFDVLRSANAGAYGAFMDEKSSLIESSADGIAEALGAPKK